MTAPPSTRGGSAPIERGLPARIQWRLAAIYGVDRGPPVEPFIEPSDDEREALFVREEDGDLLVKLRLPRAVVEQREGVRPPTFDELCQAVEGVSHFLYLAERARRELPTTELELELQAEVDKFLLLCGPDASVRPERAARVRARLFEGVRYLHEATTERGARYRMANDLAARFARRLELGILQGRRGEGLGRVRATLRRFYGAGQAEKIELARAA